MINRDAFLDVKVCCTYCGATQIANTGEWPGIRIYVVCWKCDTGYYNWIRPEYKKQYKHNYKKYPCH